MAANLNYNVNVNTTAGVQALSNLQNKVAGVSNAFGGLKNAIGGIAVGAAISSILRFADGIQDLSAATGVASGNILGFQKAVQAFGGSADIADKAILRLVTNIGSANDGSAELQGAFGKIGVSLKDLATLSEQDILAKTIKGLEGITDKSEQAFIKQQLLGKEFRNVATSGLAEAYANSTKESQKYAESIARAAELQDNLDKALGRVKLTLLEILDPIAKFVNSLDQERLGSFIENIVKLAAAFVALSALSRATVAIQALQVAFGGLLATTLGLVVNVLKFGTIFGRVLTAIGAAAIALSAIFPETAAKINAALGEATDAVKEFFGFKPEDNTAVINNNTAATEDAAKAAAAAAEITRKQKSAIDELKNSIGNVTANFVKMNEQNIAAIRLQTELVGKTREEIDVRTAEIDIAKRASDEIAKLIEQKSKLNEAQKQQGGEALINAEIAKIEERAKIDTETTQQAIKNLEAKRNAYEALKAVQDFAYKTEIEGVRKVQDIMDDMRLSTMSGLEKSYEEIAISSRKSAEAAIDAENSRRRSAGLAKLTADETKRYYDEANKGNAQLQRATEEAYNNSRRFSTGWKKAFNEYADNATNAAKQAENLFKKATQGMEDVIVKFAKTGKFEWKGFVNDMLEQLLRSQIQSTFAGILGGITGSMGKSGGGGASGGGGGGGGILDSIAGLFGGGGGGAPGSSANNPMYVIDIGGGGGGGGFMGPMQDQGQGGGGLGAIWDTVSGIGTSIWDGVSGAVGGIVDGISGAFGGIADAVGGIFGGGGGGGGGGFFDSIGSLFDGFFANGGQIGAGKFGVVGENGPEFVSGPANVTPMGGGSTSVTYNINAVDAQSFKQMLAQDPSFIYGLSMQGAKGVPARR
jgi:lambda family phage tail tape measure protein